MLEEINKGAQKSTDKMMEACSLSIINVRPDALWHMNIKTGIIYRSAGFTKITGYSKAETISTAEWFLEKIHPADRERIKGYVRFCCRNFIEHWDNEYKFLCADGRYIYLSDRAQAIYLNGKLAHITGLTHDITERKKLELQILEEKLKQQRRVKRAIIKERERERKRIGRELHDNVNQLLTSAKLYIGLAKNNLKSPLDFLQKANEYLGEAVEEIRNLTKRITTSVITNVGLQKNLVDIGSAMMILRNIELHTFIMDEVVEKLSAEQQLMIYRIVQEQTTNIMKYAEGDKAIITLKEKDHYAELIISDNGIGFDQSANKPTGIGFKNIFNRVNVHHGSVNIISSPGNGCKLTVLFPITVLRAIA